MRKSPQIQSVNKALQVLDLFIEQDQLGITDISKKLNFSKAVVYKLVITLEQFGYLRQIAENKKYRLGPKSFELGSRYLTRNNNLSNLIHHNAYPILNELMKKTGCTSQLGVVETSDLEVLIVASVESDSIIKVSASLGDRIPLHGSVVGKCFLAFSDDSYLAKTFSKPLKPLTPKTIVDRESIIKEIEKVKKQGYALADEEWAEGVFAIAAPVFDFLNMCIGAILISFPVNKKKDYNLNELVQFTYSTAQNFSQLFGASQGYPGGQN